MTDAELIAMLQDVDVVALTLWAEAQNQRAAGRQAVADVIRNRVKDGKPARGRTFREVCLKPKQFSCWNPGEDKNHLMLLDAARVLLRGTGLSPLLKDCLDVARQAMNNQPPEDSVMGATHYCTEAIWRSGQVKWAQGMAPVCQIGDHVFFKGVA